MAEEKTPSFLGQPKEVTDRKYNNLLSGLTSQTVGGRSFSEIFKAIEDAEVGGDKNAAGWPYIFTKSSGKSSAFGPAQILYSTALDYFYDGANETEQRKNMKAGNFKEGYTQLPADVKSYIKKFIEQGIKKRNRKGGVYGSLGVGDISRADHEKYYPFLFGVHVQEKKKIADEDTVKSFVDAHYGSTTGSTEEETAAREFALGRLQTKVQASLGDTGIAEAPDTAADDFKSITSDKLEIPDDVVEPGTTDTLEDVEQEQFQADVDAADRDEQLQQAESLKVQTAKAIPPTPEPEQPSFLERLFGRDEPTQEALDAKKSVLERLGRFKNQPVVSGVPTMNKGGVSIKEQMSMFDDGGLLDEGGTTDPVSGNDVPPGSMQEEVRDDIPAQLSEGEFVFPADVVRYIGLEKLMQLRQEAKMGLKRMEEMGQMGNSDEATIPDDLPFTLDDLELEAEPVEMQLGGFVDPNITLQQSQFGQPPMRPPVSLPVMPPYTPPPPPPAPFVPTQQAATPVMAAPEVLPTFEQLMPAPEGRYDELVEFENKDTGQKMTIPFVNGEPIYPIPSGFTRIETDIVEPTEPPETVVPTAQTTSPDDDGDSTNDENFASSDVTGIGYDKNRLDDSLRSAINQYGFGFGALGETFNIGSGVAREFSKDPKARTGTLTSSAFGGILDAYRGGNVSFSVPGRVGSKTGKYDDNTRLHEMSVQRQRAIAATATSVMSELEGIYLNEDGSAKTEAEVTRSQRQLAKELGIDIYVKGTDILKPTNTLMREIANQTAEIKLKEEARLERLAAEEARLAKEARQRRRIAEASRLAVGSEERNRAFGERDDSSSTGFTEGSIIDTAVREAIQDVATTADNYQSTGGYYDDYE